MNNISKKEWAKKMLELDLKAQSGAIWIKEKHKINAEKKIKHYLIEEQNPDLLKPDPIYYNGKPI